MVYLKRSYTEGKKKKKKLDGSVTKIELQRCLPESGDSRRNKTSFLKTNRELHHHVKKKKVRLMIKLAWKLQKLVKTVRLVCLNC